MQEPLMAFQFDLELDLWWSCLADLLFRVTVQVHGECYGEALTEVCDSGCVCVWLDSAPAENLHQHLRDLARAQRRPSSAPLTRLIACMDSGVLEGSLTLQRFSSVMISIGYRRPILEASV